LVSNLLYNHGVGVFFGNPQPTSVAAITGNHGRGFRGGVATAARQVIALIRQQAARIQDRESSPLPVPLAPHLLPIANPGQIRWRGAAGATSYEVHRGPSAEGPWELIGQDISEVLELIPAKLYVRSDKREKRACETCEAAVIRAPRGDKIVAGGQLGCSIGAQIVYDKYELGLPLHRQRRTFKRMGMTLSELGKLDVARLGQVEDVEILDQNSRV
jgi:hypothetical protein